MQAGQPQQIIIQPSALSAAFQQQQLSSLPQQQLLTLPQQQFQQLQPQVQIIQSGFPLQLTGAPIPLLSAGGQLLGTVGGVSSHAQLLANLQSFTSLLLQGQQGSTYSLPFHMAGSCQMQQQQQQLMGQLAAVKQEPAVGQFWPQQRLVATPTSMASSSLLNLVNPCSTQLQNLQQSQPLLHQMQQQPQQQQQLFSLMTSNLAPGLSNVQQPLTSLALQNFAQGSAAVTAVSTTPLSWSGTAASSSVPTTTTLPGLPQPTFLSQQPSSLTSGRSCATPSSTVTLVSSVASPSSFSVVHPSSSSSTSPMAHLVQDPVTGLYNLVQTSQTITTPSTVSLATLTTSHIQSGAVAAVSSPKRSCATPVQAGGGVGSPAKAAKLLMPSLGNSQEVGRTTTTPASTPTTKFMCGVCSKYFGNTKNLRVHISEIHEGKRGQFPCDVCGKVFPRKRNMERHKNALHLKTNPRCRLCEKVVVNLDMHVKRFHRASEDSGGKLHNFGDSMIAA